MKNVSMPGLEATTDPPAPVPTAACRDPVMNLYDLVTRQCTCGTCFSLLARPTRIPWIWEADNRRWRNSKYGFCAPPKQCALSELAEIPPGYILEKLTTMNLKVEELKLKKKRQSDESALKDKEIAVEQQKTDDEKVMRQKEHDLQALKDRHKMMMEQRKQKFHETTVVVKHEQSETRYGHTAQGRKGTLSDKLRRERAAQEAADARPDVPRVGIDENWSARKEWERTLLTKYDYTEADARRKALEQFPVKRITPEQAGRFREIDAVLERILAPEVQPVTTSNRYLALQE